MLRPGTEPRFCSTMRATGHDWGDSDKFQQYGWRCTKKEDACSTRTLIGNWNEEQHDLHSLAQRKPLPSQSLKKKRIPSLGTSRSCSHLTSRTPATGWTTLIPGLQTQRRGERGSRRERREHPKPNPALV
ncbi:UPF0686 protein C11orf1 homolog isoform X2 [Polyodon spathula]|uniref:UPF0686 protein C11orf1 homolog isoform X2 n=1 Tax=Polyodon spathula TaxID=7913 RepID=UPI001B7E45B1|nr:UPF0686 protein C11orf1 homolog isoform X2 [Polyodon spathula]